MPDSLESRVAVNVDNIARLFVEQDRQRERIHNLGSAVAAVRLECHELSDLKEELPTLARQAAREAVTEFNRRKHSDALANWRTYAALLSAGIALGALIVSLALR